MSRFLDDHVPHQAANHSGDPCVPAYKARAKAKAMMHPDDIHKIAILLVAGSAAAIAIFSLRIISVGLGG